MSLFIKNKKFPNKVQSINEIDQKKLKIDNYKVKRL